MRSRTVRIRAVFHPNDKDAITVLRVAAVANDLDTLARLLPTDEVEAAVAHGIRRYFLRMTAVHVSELKRLCSRPEFDRAVRRFSRRPGFDFLELAATDLRRSIDQPALRAVMTLMRNKF